MAVIGFFQNNKSSLSNLVASIKAEKIDFFDYPVVCAHINYMAANRFVLRLYNESLFLNSVYVDWFNHRDFPEICDSYDIAPSKVRKLIDLSREVHDIIHAK